MFLLKMKRKRSKGKGKKSLILEGLFQVRGTANYALIPARSYLCGPTENPKMDKMVLMGNNRACSAEFFPLFMLFFI